MTDFFAQEARRVAYTLMVRRLRDAGAVVDTSNMDPAVRPVENTTRRPQ